jgi:hypothetical protein
VLVWIIGGIAGLAWILTIVEWIGTLCFSALVFRIGIVVFRETQALPPSPIGSDDRLETDNAVYRSAGPNCWLFRFRVRIFGFTLHTPFLVKGTARWEGTSVTTTGRIPVFPIVFLVAWALGFTAGGVMVIRSDESAWLGIGLLLLGWLFALGLCLISIPFEIQRARLAFEEIHEALSSPSARR